MNMEPVAEENNGQMKERTNWRAADDPKADLKLISSDEWVFWVQSGQLTQVSPVFKEMLETCASPDTQATLHLTDPDIESALPLFDSLMVIKSQAENDHVELYHTFRDGLDMNMVNFAKKYDISSTLDAIKLHLFELASEFPPMGGKHVLVAATLEEWNLCGRLVMGLDAWQGNGWIDCDEHMRQMLDWRGWTPEIIQELSKISEKFLWAVCQVGTKHARAAGHGGISYAAMGPDLARVMASSDLVWDSDKFMKDWVQGNRSWWVRPYRER